MKKAAATVLLFVIMLTLSTCTAAEEDPSAAAECLNAMINAVVSGDRTAGLEAQREQEKLIKESGSKEQSISYDQLDALSRFIATQATGYNISDELLLCAGEVALNRVASPEFPNDIKGVCIDFGITEEEYDALRPSRACVIAALKLLRGERLLSGDVLYISDKKDGEVFATFYTRLRGYTYFLTKQ